MKRLILSIILISLLVSALVPFSYAADEAEAKDLTKSATMTATDGYSTARLTDQNEKTHFSFLAGEQLTIEAGEEIAGIYIKFYASSLKWTAAANGNTIDFGQLGFLHEYANVSKLKSNKIVLTFSEFADISEVQIFTRGKLPPEVQIWQPSYEKADMLLLSSHSDDEQLFFAGLIPHAVANSKKLQVVYFCHHNDVPARLHEQLNGLWAAGATNYPVIGRFPDLYSESLDGAIKAFAGKGFKEDDFIKYQVEVIRRFKPSVVVAHDVNGEYGHGTHMLNTSTLIKALELTPDETAYPELAAQYGTWDVPKTYVHLWKENMLTMNYDVPLDFFGGKTAYQKSVEGYGEHYSQHWTWFTRWLKGTDAAPITSAAQIEKYSPCSFGLYRSTVGADSGINDMFENIKAEAVETSPETTEEETTVTAATQKVTEEQTTAENDIAPNGTSGIKTAAMLLVIAFAMAVIVCVILIIKK